MTNRRTFIKKSGLSLAATSLFPYIPFRQERKIGVALVGLGYYSRDLLAPALQLTKHCALRGIVTGSPEKIPKWQKRYNIPDTNVYNYEQMHEMANNPDIDVAYIVLPNGLHHKYTLIAAEAGKHVWCEKPMALTVKECQEMIEVCKKNRVQLTVGYRMQHEPVTQTIMRWAKEKPYGAVRELYAEAGYFNGGGNGTHWKLFKALGGGAMYDMGVYPLNAVRYATGMEPLRVRAKIERPRADVFESDEITSFDLEFKGELRASCKTSFAGWLNQLKVTCADGGYQLEPFQAYSGVQGLTSDGKRLEPFSGNQQARQMDDDALAILNNEPPLVPGEEGMKDIRVVEKIFESAEQGSAWLSL